MNFITSSANVLDPLLRTYKM